MRIVIAGGPRTGKTTLVDRRLRTHRRCGRPREALRMKIDTTSGDVEVVVGDDE